jgi:threonine/homoserine/homoserine lactone efflux protein
MAPPRWYKVHRRGLRCIFVASVFYLIFLAAKAYTSPAATKEFETATKQGFNHYSVDRAGQAFMARIGSMRSAFFALASSTLVASQNATSYDGASTASSGTPTTDSVVTATIDGVATTFSNAFTVPASADIGPNLLPNVKDPHAVQAQDVCPGYTASGVEKTANGFTATLSLAGEPVGTRRYGLRSYSG